MHRHYEPDAQWHGLRQALSWRLADPRMQLALNRSYRLDHDYDIANVSGISTDLKTLYIDRHFPLDHREGDIVAELWLHECSEALFMMLWGDYYARAHTLSTIAEHDTLVWRGIDWNKYKAHLALYSKKSDKITRSPRDLFLRPYEQHLGSDWLLLQRIRDTMR